MLRFKRNRVEGSRLLCSGPPHTLRLGFGPRPTAYLYSVTATLVPWVGTRCYTADFGSCRAVSIFDSAVFVGPVVGVSQPRYRPPVTLGRVIELRHEIARLLGLLV